MITDEERRLAKMLPLDPSPSARDHNIRPNLVDLSLNYNNVPYKSDTAIICTSHRGHLVFLRETLRSYKESGKFVICAYDPPGTGWTSDQYFAENMPDLEINLAAHAWVHKHVTYENEKRNGWYWDVKYAQGIVSEFENFEYIFTVNGDCIWEKPTEVNKLIELLGDDDLMSVSSDHNTIHTCAVVFKRKAFMDIMDYMSEYHKVSIIGSYSPERLLFEAVRELGFKEKKVPKQPQEPGHPPGTVDHYSRYRQPHTWNDIVGYRNLGSEWLTTLIERYEPVERKYINFKFFNTVFSWCTDHVRKYYETGDRRYLYMAWDRNEDSWYDRVYYPIERYDELVAREKEEKNNGT